MQSRKFKCRWFQFKLRTLLAGISMLALPSAWLGSQVKIVRDRDAAVARIRAAGGDSTTADDIWIVVLEPTGVPSASAAPGNAGPISGIRRWLGDEDYETIGVPAGFSRSDEQKIRDQFPEAIVGKILASDTSAKITTEPCIKDLDNRISIGR